VLTYVQGFAELCDSDGVARLKSGIARTPSGSPPLPAVSPSHPPTKKPYSLEKRRESAAFTLHTEEGATMATPAREWADCRGTPAMSPSRPPRTLDRDAALLVEPQRCPPGTRAARVVLADGRLPDGDRLVDGEPFLRWLETGEGDPWATSSG
jgi:hypothetical protein